jgi:hypothetical protein
MEGLRQRPASGSGNKTRYVSFEFFWPYILLLFLGLFGGKKVWVSCKGEMEGNDAGGGKGGK